MRGAILWLVFLTACVGPPIPGSGGGVQCETAACPLGDEVFCDIPEVRLGQGPVGYEPLEDGAMPITFGIGNNGGCGYHLEMAVQTEHLCPILRVDYDVYLIGIDGGPIAGGTSTVQFLREEDTSSVQSIWNRRAFLPPEYFPNDPEHADVCPGGQELPCDESQFLIEVAVEDLTGRSASAEYLLDPVCCSP